MKEKPLDNEVITETCGLLRDIASVLEDYESGTDSFNKVCHRHGMDTAMVRRVLALKSLRNCRLSADPIPLAEAIPPAKDGYERIYDDVFQYNETDAAVDLPVDYIESVEMALDELTDLEKKIMRLYYGLDNDSDGMTYEEVGKVFGVTRERVRQVHVRALRKLQYVPRKKMLRIGYLQYKADKEAAEAERLAYETVVQAKKDLYIEKVNKTLSQDIREIKDSDVEALSGFYNTNIDSLDLSVRAYNCLKRAGITTVGELLEKSQEELMKVRNLGRHSLEEVNKKIEYCKIKLGAELASIKGGDADVAE